MTDPAPPPPFVPWVEDPSGAGAAGPPPARPPWSPDRGAASSPWGLGPQTPSRWGLPPQTPWSGLDPNAWAGLAARLLGPLAGRVAPPADVRDLTNLPRSGPALVVLNATGPDTARDLSAFLRRWADHAGSDARALPGYVSFPRFIDPESGFGALSMTRLLAGLHATSDRAIGAVLGRGGIVVLYPENAVDLLSHGVYRGPVAFQPTVIAMALAHGAAIVPVACLGGETFSWNAGVAGDTCPGIHIQVGAPLRLTLHPHASEPADLQHAANALRDHLRDMLHDLHAAACRGGRPRSPELDSVQNGGRPPMPPASAIHDGGRPPMPPASTFGSFPGWRPPSWLPGQGAAPFEGLAGILSRWAPSARFGALGPTDPCPCRSPAPPPAADAALARRVAVLEAESQVARAMFTWGRALDQVERSHDAADARHIALELMTPDGIMDFAATGWGVWGPGKEALVAEIVKFSRRIRWSYHTYPNGEITVDPEAGTARFWTTTELVPIAVEGEFQWYFLTQRTDFRRLGDAWKVARYTLSDLRVARTTPGW
jgi:SnoaL-like domain